MTGGDSDIERYADKFAAELLMPYDEMLSIAKSMAPDGRLSFDDVLSLSEIFGVSFEACLFRAAWDLHMVSGDTSSSEVLRRRAREYAPNTARKRLGASQLPLYAQLIDAIAPFLTLPNTPLVKRRFKTEYVYHDSRMENVRIEKELAAEIVVDLERNGRESRFYSEENRDLVEVAGLARVYDRVLTWMDNPDQHVGIETVRELNKLLYSTSAFPEYAGSFRTTDALVLGSLVGTVEWWEVPARLQELEGLLTHTVEKDALPISGHMSEILRIHHRMTVIHPFNDGNGRTTRALTNVLLIRMGLPPVLFSGMDKANYKQALARADKGEELDDLTVVYIKAMLQAYAILTTNPVLDWQ